MVNQIRKVAFVKLEKAVRLFLISVFCLSAIPAYSEKNDFEVKIEKNIVVTEREGVIRAIHFHYSFPSKESVFIKNVGLLPATGQVGYLCRCDEIEFSENESAPPFHTVSLLDSIEMMGRFNIMMPSLQEFPSSYREGRWNKLSSFTLHKLNVLNQRFPSGLLSLSIDNQPSIVTTYSSLEGLPKRIYGEIALLISDESLKADKKVTFRVKFIVRERRSHTGWRSEIGNETRKVAENYVSDIMNVLVGRSE